MGPEARHPGEGSAPPSAAQRAADLPAVALLAAGAPPSAERTPPRPRRRWLQGVRRLLQRPPALLGVAIIVAFVGCALAAPWLSPYDPLHSDYAQVRHAPSVAHWLGTDELGRDVLSRLIWGARASLLAGVLSILIAMGIGVPLGLVSGYYRGLLDGVVMRLTDAWLSFPYLILAIGLMSVLGASLFNACIAIGLAATPSFVRLTRGQVLALREEDYVQGARALGASDARVLARHVLPNLASILLVQATVAIPGAVISESVLSFLGLGVQPPQPSWGTMLNSAQSFLDSAPWMAWFPGLCIFAVALAFNLAGDGLRDMLDPKEY